MNNVMGSVVHLRSSTASTGMWLIGVELWGILKTKQSMQYAMESNVKMKQGMKYIEDTEIHAVLKGLYDSKRRQRQEQRTKRR